ncbi:MAG: MOSC domain-containing protein [Ramlibacter sp.]
MNDLRSLVSQFPRPGRLEEILLRPARGAPMVQASECMAVAGFGLDGDRTAKGRGGGKRQVTLLQAEHLPVVAALLRRDVLHATDLRRNLVVSGLNLVASKSLFADQRIQVQVGQDVLIEITGPCEPCSKMEDRLGPGAYNALRGHGGVTARIVQGGRIATGDAVLCRVVVHP